MSVVGDAFRESGASLRTVFANRSIRNIMVAFTGSLIGDWAYATAVAVWAYGVGGADLVALWAVIRYVLMAVVTPLGATLVDRMSRKTIMVVVDLARCVLLVVIAAILSSAPTVVVFVLAGTVAVLGTPFRPAQRSLLPSLVSRPEELTAVNGTSSTLESLTFFVGPALAAALLATTSVETVLLFDAVTFLWSAFFVWRVHPAPAQPLPTAVPAPVTATAPAPVTAGPGAGGDLVATETDDGAGPDDGAPAPPVRFAFLREVSAGFAHIGRHPDLRTVIALTCAQTFVAGASAVFVVAIAFDLVDLGPSGVGLLDSMLGVGALVGGFVALSRASRQRLGFDFCIGVILWSLPLVLIAVWPTVAVALLVMALLGLANPLVDVNLDTLLQRLTPDALMGRVFGALETAYIASMAVGAGTMPFLIHWLGLPWSMAAIGLAVTLLVLPAIPRMLRMDRTLVAPAELPMLQAIPLFAPLSAPVLEGLARQLSTRVVPAGELVFDEGEPGDLFYVIESGRVEVSRAGAVLRHEDAGDYFGEIALLRDVPRTARIRAVQDTVLRGLDREAFLAAVLGNVEAVTAAENVVARRILAG